MEKRKGGTESACRKTGPREREVKKPRDKGGGDLAELYITLKGPLYLLMQYMQVTRGPGVT